MGGAKNESIPCIAKATSIQRIQGLRPETALDPNTPALAYRWVDYEGAQPKAIGVMNQEGVDYLGNPSTSQTLQADTTSPNAR